MKKRSKYRPKPQFADPLGVVLRRLEPMRLQSSYMLDMKIKNHAALRALVRGEATRDDLSTLIAMNNIVEALHRMGTGTDYRDVLMEGHKALLEVSRRFESGGAKVTLYAQEINAMNLHMELHDAMMDVITVHDMDKALAIVNRELALGRFEPVRVKLKLKEPA